jgi:hypothetical protein
VNWYPILWIAVVVVAAALEAVALAGKRRPLDTLSRNVQWLVLRERRVRVVALVVWFAFAIWFPIHLNLL